MQLKRIIRRLRLFRLTGAELPPVSLKFVFPSAIETVAVARRGTKQRENRGHVLPVYRVTPNRCYPPGTFDEFPRGDKWNMRGEILILFGWLQSGSGNFFDHEKLVLYRASLKTGLVEILKNKRSTNITEYLANLRRKRERNAKSQNLFSTIRTTMYMQFSPCTF